LDFVRAMSVKIAVENGKICKTTEPQNAKRRREKQDISDQKKDRNVSAKYYVFIKDGDSLVRAQVCAKAFCSLFENHT